jgi:hypothetical protein
MLPGSAWVWLVLARAAAALVAVGVRSLVYSAMHPPVAA